MNTFNLYIILIYRTMEVTMDILEIKHLKKKYGENVAVNDLNLCLKEKKVYGFLGPNGAGKTTTMNIITGYISADSGSVKIDGSDITKQPIKVKKDFGYLPELPPLYQDMTVNEYLKFSADLKKVKGIEDVIQKTGLVEVKDKLIRNLSKGYKQRVGIAQAILGKPKLVILDEPTVGLDPKQIIEIRELIKELKNEHTVLFSSHILTEVSEICDEIFIISNGKIIASGTEENLADMIKGGSVVRIEAKGKEVEVSNLITSIKDVEGYSIESKKGITVAEINTEKNVDIRERLFYAFAKKNIPILSMNRVVKTLEDVYLDLVESDKNNDRT